MSKELDFTLLKGKDATKVFKFTNEDESIYDFTGSTVRLNLHLTGTPTVITGAIDISTGKVSFAFTSTHTVNEGNFEYIIEETKDTSAVIPLIKGNTIISPETPFSTSINAFIRSELPTNLELTEDYKQQRILYWRLFLQEAAVIEDADLHVEANWPLNYNMLISKLVVYDALLRGAKYAFVETIGGSNSQSSSEETSSGGVKKIETGPASVEYFDTSTAVKEAFASGSGSDGLSLFDTLNINLCGLANKMGIKLPMCRRLRTINPIIPQYSQNPDWDYPTLDELVEVPSQG